MAAKTIAHNLMETKSYQTGVHSILEDGAVVNGVPDEMVYVSQESELSAYADKPAGTFAATYGFTKMWQLGADGGWIVIGAEEDNE